MPLVMEQVPLPSESASKSVALEQANALAERGDFEAALPLFRAAFDDNADAARIAESFSQCCLAIDKYFAATHAAASAVILDPEWPDGFLTLARACWECGKAAMAIEDEPEDAWTTDAWTTSCCPPKKERHGQVSEEAMAWVVRSARLCIMAVDRGFDDMEEIAEDIVASCRPLVLDTIKSESWAVVGECANPQEFMGCPHAAGPGAHIWASGETLAAFLWAAWPRFIEQRVLELGAGSGVVSLILARRFCDRGKEIERTEKEARTFSSEEKPTLPLESAEISASDAAQCVDGALSTVGQVPDRAKRRRHSVDKLQIVATDIPGVVLDKLEENIQKQTKVDTQHCSISAAQLRWGDCEADLDAHVLPKWTSDAGDDLLILGADIVYNVAQVPLLVHCLQVLFRGKGKVKARRMLLGHQARMDELDSKMLADLNAAGFVVKTLFDAKLPFQNGSKHIRLYEITT